MITIEQRRPRKMPGEYSLFITFDYQKELVDCMKNLDPPVNFDKKTREWETTLTNLSSMINSFSEYDSIKLKLLKEEPLVYKDYVLNNYKTKSFKHQLEAVQYGLNHDSFLLLDEPGLGKSKSAINLAEELHNRYGIQHCLIVCGINSLKFNWLNEISKHSYLSGRILGQRFNKRGTLHIGKISDRVNDLNTPLDEFFVITNIETLRDDNIVKGILKGKNQFDMIIVDEIHTCKNVSAIQTKHLLKLSEIKYKLGLTGTLLITNPLDCYAPLKFIKAETGTNTNFKYYYCNFSGPFNSILTSYKNLNVLKEQLNKNSLRRTKDLLDLPPKNVIHEYLEMSPEQEAFYQDVKNGEIKQADLVNISTTSLLALVARLRQISDCPHILSSKNIPCTKIDRAVDLAEQILSNPNEKVVLFANFKATTDMLMQKLAKYNPLLATGDIPDNKVNRAVKDFQENPKCRVFIATWQRCGTGLTLNAASNMIMCGVPWSSSECEQVEDRIHRIGTKKPVFIYYLWTKNTFDEKVKQIIEDKGLLSNFIVNDNLPPQMIDRLKQLIADL